MRATVILGTIMALSLMLGLGWGLTHMAEGGTHVVPPVLPTAMLAVGLVLIGVGFYRRN